MGDDCLKALVELAELPDKSAALLMVCSMGRSLGDSGAYYQCTQVRLQVPQPAALRAASPHADRLT